MLWTAEAVEDLKRLALEGKSASHIAAALGVGSRNAVIGKASRIGIKLNGGGRAAASRKRGARGSAQWATAQPTRPNAATRLRPRRRARSPGHAGAGQGAAWTLWRSRDRRDAAAAVRGHSRIPPAGGRSAIREAGTSPIAGSRRRRASPIAPAIAGWPIGRRRRGRARTRAARTPRHREFVAAVLRRRAATALHAVCLEHADQAGRVRARFAPRRRRLDEERPQAGLARGRLDVERGCGRTASSARA